MMDDYMIGRKDAAIRDADPAKMQKADLIQLVRILREKLANNEKIANLPPATDGALIEELHARGAKRKSLQYTGE